MTRKELSTSNALAMEKYRRSKVEAASEKRQLEVRAKRESVEATEEYQRQRREAIDECKRKVIGISCDGQETMRLRYEAEAERDRKLGELAAAHGRRLLDIRERKARALAEISSLLSDAYFEMNAVFDGNRKIKDEIARDEHGEAAVD